MKWGAWRPPVFWVGGFSLPSDSRENEVIEMFEYSELMSAGGMRAQVNVRKDREERELRVRVILLDDPEKWEWAVHVRDAALADWLLNMVSAVELLVDIEDNARKLVACGCGNAEGIYRAAVSYTLSGHELRAEAAKARGWEPGAGVKC